MKEEKFVLGIPDGSMIDENRGNLVEMVERAFIKVEGLGNCGAKAPYIKWLELIVQRPQELPKFAADGICDVFICGDDCAREWEIQGCPSEKMIALDIGKVDIVAAAKPGNNRFLTAASEYPYIARQYIIDKFGAKEVQIIRGNEKRRSKYAVIESKGKTELKIVYGIADFVVENAQTGNTIRSLGLEIVDKIMESECSLYKSSRKMNKWKEQKADNLAIMLEGAKDALQKYLVIFNVSNSNLGSMIDYIRKNKLYGDEETIKEEKKNSEITIEVSANNPAQPFADILPEIKRLGGTCIYVVSSRCYIR